MPECPDCEQDYDGRRCPCGYKPPRPVLADRKPRTCSVDGAVLEANGYCYVGSGYPVTMSCPYACPHCGQFLDWDGGCSACHGAPSGRREDWSYPGVGHDLVAGHWRPDPSRPVNRRACTDAENASGLAAVRAILDAAPPLSRPDPAPKRARRAV